MYIPQAVSGRATASVGRMCSGRKGFTIVELLIVVVVIAILATITIVAYNGIQQRAKASSLQSAVSQAGRKALSYSPQNADQYPLESSYTQDLALPGSTPQATYDYYVSDNRRAFCLSVTDTTVGPEAAYAFTQSGAVVKGRCVKNYIPNPAFTIDAAGWSTAFQTSVAQRQAAGGIDNSGRYAIRKAPGAADPLVSLPFPVSTFLPNTDYTISYWNWADSTQAQQQFIGLQENGGGWRQLVTHGSGQVTTAPTRRSITAATPSDTHTVTRFLLRPTVSDSTTSYFDNIMVTKGSILYTYADPSTDANWSWVGTAHNSASFGPATPAV